MRSRINIGLADDNQPIIEINYQPSEDVRDKMVKRFLESFGNWGTKAQLYYPSPSQDNSFATLRPIHEELGPSLRTPEEMQEDLREIIQPFIEGAALMVGYNGSRISFEDDPEHEGYTCCYLQLGNETKSVGAVTDTYLLGEVGALLSMAAHNRNSLIIKTIKELIA